MEERIKMEMETISLSAHISAAVQLALQCPRNSAIECLLKSLNAPVTNGRFVFVKDEATQNCATIRRDSDFLSLQPDRCTENLVQSGSSVQTIPQTPDECAAKPLESGKYDHEVLADQRLANLSAIPRAPKLPHLIQLTGNRAERLRRHREVEGFKRHLTDISNTMQPSDCNVPVCSKFLDDLDDFQINLIDLQLHPEIVSILTRLSKLKVAVNPATREIAKRAMRKCKSLMQSCNIDLSEGVLFRSLVLQYQAVLQNVPSDLYYLVVNDQQLAHLNLVRNEPLSDVVRQCFEHCQRLTTAAEFQNDTNIRLLVDGEDNIADIFRSYVPIPPAWQCTLLQNVRLIERSTSTLSRAHRPTPKTPAKVAVVRPTKSKMGPQKTKLTKKLSNRKLPTAKPISSSGSPNRAVVDVNELEDDDSQMSSTTDDLEQYRSSIIEERNVGDAVATVLVSTPDRRESVNGIVTCGMAPSRLVDLQIECISIDEQSNADGMDMMPLYSADKDFLKLNESVQDLIEDMAMQHPRAAPVVSLERIEGSTVKSLDVKPVPNPVAKTSRDSDRRIMLKLTVNRAKKMRKHFALHTICQRLVALVPKNIPASECDLDACASLLDDLNRFQITKICLQLHPEIVSVLSRLQHLNSKEAAHRELRIRVGRKVAEFMKTCRCALENVYQFRLLVKKHQHVLQVTPPELHYLVELVVHFNRLTDMLSEPLPEPLRQCFERCRQMKSPSEFAADTNIRQLIVAETNWIHSHAKDIDVNDIAESADEMIEQIFKTYVPLELAWHLTLLSHIQLTMRDTGPITATTVVEKHGNQDLVKMEPPSPSQLGASWRQDVEVIELNPNQTVDLTTDSEDDDNLLTAGLPHNQAAETFDASQYIRQCVRESSHMARTPDAPSVVPAPSSDEPLPSFSPIRADRVQNIGSRQAAPSVEADAAIWFEETQQPSIPSPPRVRVSKAKRKLAKPPNDPDRTVILRHDFQPLEFHLITPSRSNSSIAPAESALKRKTDETVALQPVDIESIEFVIEDPSMRTDENLEDDCTLLASIPLGTDSQLRKADEQGAAVKQSIPPRNLNFRRPTLYEDI